MKAHKSDKKSDIGESLPPLLGAVRVAVARPRTGAVLRPTSAKVRPGSIGLLGSARTDSTPSHCG
jgi:hypothetical protein